MTVQRSQPIITTVTTHRKAAARIQELELQLRNAKRALTWIVNSPNAHPANMVKVAEDGLSHRSAKT